MPNGRILLAANAPFTEVRRVSAMLERSGYLVLTAGRGADAVRMLAFRQPDLVLLDLTLSGMESMETLRAVRRVSTTPVIVLAAAGSNADLLHAFASGADDYLIKPFNPDELVARIAAVLSRVRSASRGERSAVLRYPGVEIDLDHRTVTVDRALVRLSATEWAILALLGANVGKVMRTSELLWPVVGPERGEDANYLRTWISRVRGKLEPNGPHTLIVTHPGRGYCLTSPPEPATSPVG